MIQKMALHLKLIPAVLFLVASANASAVYSFQTLNNSGDSQFNQLLGVSSTSSPTIVGYFGDGTALPNKGYTLVQPYNSQGSYTNENFPGSAQTQVVGITPGGAGTTVGFYIDSNGNNIGFVDQGGTFTSVSDPSTPAAPGAMVNQLLGVSDNNIAAGFYIDAAGDMQGYTYNLTTATFTPITLPMSFGAMDTTVTGINDAGVITGFYTDAAGNTHGFVDNAGTFTSFDDPNGADTMFLGINASDMIAGSYLDGAGETEGLVFDYLTDSFQTVDDPLASNMAAFGVDGTTINGINNAGDLVGFYSDGTNVDGFLATPTPEPATIGFMILCGALIVGKHRRGQKAQA
ncbi:MAG TPA: hypothetical protein VME17_09920 [Bryobacteraceae bacterium]|nr:hypothetical protein [Bryobacteraceae bacterium]